MEQTKKACNPRGLATKKPIALRLMPQELADADRIATERGQSKSSLAREAYLVGIKIISLPSGRQEGSIGGATSSGPADLSNTKIAA